MSDTLFEYIDPSSGTVVEPTGLWEARTAAVSFEAGAALADEAPVWRVNLSRDSRVNEQGFLQARKRLAAAQQALESAPGRLDEFVQRSARGSEGQVSFSVPEAGSPEAELTSLLDECRLAGSGTVSFGVGEEMSGALEKAKASFEAFAQSISREMLHFAWVETQVESELIARTSVRWSGNSHTLYNAGITPPQVVQHGQSLHLASASRSLKIRMFTTIATGAVKLTTLLASGGGAVLALPMAYQYVTQILAQVKEYQALQGSSQ